MKALHGRGRLVAGVLIAGVVIAYLYARHGQVEQRAEAPGLAASASTSRPHSKAADHPEVALERERRTEDAADADAALRRAREQRKLDYRKLDARVASLEREELERLGYVVPDFYSTLDVWSLRSMASTGDSYAMVTLAQKYVLELRDHPSAPDFDQDADYVELAKESLRDAVAAGNVRAAALISKIYLEQDDEATALAWSQLAVGLGDVVHAKELVDASMPPEELAEVERNARLQSPELLKEINARRARAGRPPLTATVSRQSLAAAN